MVCIQGIKKHQRRRNDDSQKTLRTLWIFNNRLYYIDCSEIPCFPSEHKFDNSPSDKKLYNSCHQSLSSTRRPWCRKSMRLRKRIALKIVELRNQICVLILNINLDRTMLITKREHIFGWVLWDITLPLLMPFLRAYHLLGERHPYVCLDTVLKEFSSEC